jgi:transcription-repair coupling factor (superfamily II helicase)
LHFNKNAPIDGIKIIQLIQSERNVQLNGQDKLKLTYKMPELKDRVARVNQVLDALKG